MGKLWKEAFKQTDLLFVGRMDLLSESLAQVIYGGPEWRSYRFTACVVHNSAVVSLRDIWGSLQPTSWLTGKRGWTASFSKVRSIWELCITWQHTREMDFIKARRTAAVQVKVNSYTPHPLYSRKQMLQLIDLKSYRSASRILHFLKRTAGILILYVVAKMFE